MRMPVTCIGSAGKFFFGVFGNVLGALECVHCALMGGEPLPTTVHMSSNDELDNPQK